MAPNANRICTYCAAAGPSENKSFSWPSPVKMQYIRADKSPNTPIVDDLSENTSFGWASPVSVMYEQVQSFKDIESNYGAATEPSEKTSFTWPPPIKMEYRERSDHPNPPVVAEVKYGATAEPAENTSFRWPSPVQMRYELVQDISESLSPVTPPSPTSITKSEPKDTIESLHVEKVEYSHEEVGTACPHTKIKCDERGLHSMVDTDASRCLWCSAAGRIHGQSLSAQVSAADRMRIDPPLREVSQHAKRWRKLTVTNVSG